MEKIFKKSLALVLSAALCLTALLGCLTVSADETTTPTAVPTYAVENVSGKPGDLVEVKVNLTDIANVCAHYLTVTFAKGLTVNTVFETAAENLESGIRKLTEFTDGAGGDYKKTVATEGDGTTVIAFCDIVNFENESSNYGNTHQFIFNVKIDDNAKANDVYDVKVTAKLANIDEEFITKFTTADGKVTVEADEPVLDTDLQPIMGVLTGDTIGVSYAFNYKQSTDPLNKYASYYLVIERNTRDDNFNFQKTSLTIDSILDVNDKTKYVAGSRVNFYYYGLELYSLNIPISATLYCRDADGNVVARSETITTSVTDIIRDKYDTARAALKTTYIDLLNLGTAAQAYYSNRYPNSDYAKIEAPNKGFSQDAATKERGDLSRIDSTTPEGSTAIQTTGAIGSAPYLMFTIIPTDISKINDYKLVLSYRNKLTNEDIVTTVNGSAMQLSARGDRYIYNMRDIKIYASDVDVTAKLYDGDTVIAEKHYSYEQYIYEKTKEGNTSATLLYNLMDAVAKFSASIRTLKEIN